MEIPVSTTAQGGAGISRRAALALGTGALVGTSGCVRRVRSLLNRDAPTQVSLSVKTVPADADARATRIARALVEHLVAVGADAQVVPMDRESLYRDVLINNNFDLYVAPFNADDNPDFLRPLLHSQFGVEAGWQNPFGYADLDVDRLLERQRRESGRDRRRTLAKIQRKIASAQPFTVVAFVDEIRAVRTDRISGWTDVHTPLGYLSLESKVDPGVGPRGLDAGEGSEGRGRHPSRWGVRMALGDARPLENLNPLAVASRDDGTITSLLYDPLGRRVDGRIQPWLADAWRWADDGRELEVWLREDLQWHDGEALTAEDAAFTYRFLQDTSMGEADSPIPAPAYRGPSSLIAGIEATGTRQFRLRLRPCSRAVARRTLQVPVLPAHIWQGKTGMASVAGINAGRGVTEALVWGNRNPVGSGPLQMARLRLRESLALVPFEDHFLERGPSDPHLRPYHGGFTPEQLVFRRSPSGEASIGMVRRGDVDGTASDVLASHVPVIGRDDALKLRVDRARTFYHVGFNVRRSPLGNPRFRRATARLLDKEHLVEDILGGYGVPAASPLARHTALASELTWTGEDPELPFPGQNGQLDTERGREAFRKAGYRYTDNGKLLAN